MISEQERRWGDWREGQPIELPDGQTWHFFEPTPEVRDGVPGWSFDAPIPELDALLSARFGLIVSKWGKAQDDAERASAILEAAWFLLARNYNVTLGEFGQIMLRSAAWDRERHERLAEHALTLVGYACGQSTALAESR